MTRVIANSIRMHPLGAFFAWFFTVGWAISFIPVVVETGVRPQLFVLASTLVGLLLPTLVITRVVNGPEGLRDLSRRMFKVRAPVRWYAVTLLGSTYSPMPMNSTCTQRWPLGYWSSCLPGDDLGWHARVASQRGRQCKPDLRAATL